jgi:hypothetical protein
MDIYSGGSTYFGPVETWARRAPKISRAQCENFLGFELVETPVIMQPSALFIAVYQFIVSCVTKLSLISTWELGI